MIRLLLKLSSMATLVIASIWGFLHWSSDGFDDRFYSKFQYCSGSMVMGTSRALMGINPEGIDPNHIYDQPFLNFAFTQSTSPYGEVYYNAIRQKLNPDSKNGLFILEVNPASIYVTDEEILPEKKFILSRMHFFCVEPNYDYIINNAQMPAYMLSINGNRKAKGVILHHSGWNRDTTLVSENDRITKVKEQSDAHVKMFTASQSPGYRLLWFGNTIDLLKQHGKVVLVRMPVSSEMNQLENQYYPAFDSLMSRCAREKGVPYYSLFTDSTYQFYDIHHMTGASAVRFTDTLRNRIFKPAE